MALLEEVCHSGWALRVEAFATPRSLSVSQLPADSLGSEVSDSAPATLPPPLHHHGQCPPPPVISSLVMIFYHRHIKVAKRVCLDL